MNFEQFYPTPETLGRRLATLINHLADSFEGRDSYQETFSNRQFYLSTNQTRLLSAGKEQKE